MLIIADENIPYVREAFRTMGEVRTMAGRAMTPQAVREAEALLVRSVTTVDEALLAGSKVKFVGTATIGTDHVDVEWLKSAGIAFSAAPGSNANSVAEYITAAMLVLAKRHGFKLEGRSLGVIGVGNVGSRVEAKARALGMTVVLNDPPLARATGLAKYRPLEALYGCDFITCHVPLEKKGPDATHHLVNEAFLARMPRTSFLFNSSRGAVADGKALLAAIEKGALAGAVLDVWENEPSIDTALLERVELGTQHIAGYSFDGKVNGTEMIYHAACATFNLAPKWKPADNVPAPEVPEITLQAGGKEDEDLLREAVLTLYPIERDDAALRGLLRLPLAQQGAYFDKLRKDYPVRREFQNTKVRVVGAGRERLKEKLRGIGFQVE